MTVRRRPFRIGSFPWRPLLASRYRGCDRRRFTSRDLLRFDLLQAFGAVAQRVSFLASRSMPRRLGDPKIPADWGEVLALVQELVALGEFSGHLFGGVMSVLDTAPCSILKHRDSQSRWIISEGSPQTGNVTLATDES